MSTSVSNADILDYIDVYMHRIQEGLPYLSPMTFKNAPHVFYIWTTWLTYTWRQHLFLQSGNGTKINISYAKWHAERLWVMGWVHFTMIDWKQRSNGLSEFILGFLAISTMTDGWIDKSVLSYVSDRWITVATRWLSLRCCAKARYGGFAKTLNGQCPRVTMWMIPKDFILAGTQTDILNHGLFIDWIFRMDKACHGERDTGWGKRSRSGRGRFDMGRTGCDQGAAWL